MGLPVMCMEVTDDVVVTDVTHVMDITDITDDVEVVGVTDVAGVTDKDIVGITDVAGVTDIWVGTVRHKNLGRLWLAYTELQGNFYMLQLTSIDSRHFTQS